MKLQAKVHNPEAAAEIRNWLENQGYIVTTQNIAGAYNIYTDLPAFSAPKPPKRKAPKMANKKPGRIENVWAYVIISTLIALFILKLL